MKTFNLIRTNLWLLFALFLSFVASTPLKAQSTKTFIHKNGDELEWIINRNISTSNYELKHTYRYDSEERIKERETFYWEKRTHKWLPYYKTNIVYNDSNTSIETAYWNWENKNFNLSKQLTDYTIDENKEIVEYKTYIWDAIDNEWKTQKHRTLRYYHAENRL